MKTLLTALLVSLTTTSAMAAPSLYCVEDGKGTDSGYTAQLNNQRTKAVIGELTKMSNVKLATLRCTRGLGRPSHPDQIYITNICSEPNLRDAGYSLIVKTGGITGLTTATLSEVTFAGSFPIAELTCQTIR